MFLRENIPKAHFYEEKKNPPNSNRFSMEMVKSWDYSVLLVRALRVPSRFSRQRSGVFPFGEVGGFTIQKTDVRG